MTNEQKRGRKKWIPNLVEIQRLSGLGLTNQEIAAYIGIAQSTLYEHMSEISETLAKGRVRQVAEMSAVVIDAAKKSGDVRAALEFLRRYGGGWKDQPEKIEQQITATVEHKSNLDIATQLRMATIFLEQQGFDISSIREQQQKRSEANIA